MQVLEKSCGQLLPFFARTCLRGGINQLCNNNSLRKSTENGGYYVSTREKHTRKTFVPWIKKGPPRVKLDSVKKILPSDMTFKQSDVDRIMEEEIESRKKRLESSEDMPCIDITNPYEKEQKRCVLCVHDVDLDYKNSRLLSQFVSPHTGQIHGRQITGLCIYMQRRVANLIKRSRYFGFMPYVLKEPKYLRDPKLYNPFQRR